MGYFRYMCIPRAILLEINKDQRSNHIELKKLTSSEQNMSGKPELNVVLTKENSRRIIGVKTRVFYSIKM
jgi:hypothetical protein